MAADNKGPYGNGWSQIGKDPVRRFDVLNMDTLIGGDRAVSCYMRIQDDTNLAEREFEVQELVAQVAELLETLYAREAAILKMRFGIGMPESTPMIRQQIARQFGITSERVAQIERAALRKLRYSRKTNQLRPYIKGWS